MSGGGGGSDPLITPCIYTLANFLGIKLDYWIERQGPHHMSLVTITLHPGAPGSIAFFSEVDAFCEKKNRTQK